MGLLCSSQIHFWSFGNSKSNHGSAGGGGTNPARFYPTHAARTSTGGASRILENVARNVASICRAVRIVVVVVAMATDAITMSLATVVVNTALMPDLTSVPL